MKKKAVYLFLAISGLFFLRGNAQEQSLCDQNLKATEQNIESRDFTSAYNSLTTLRKNCEKFDEKVYVFGEKIITYYIESSQPEEKQKYIDDLILLYGEQAKSFPHHSKTNTIKKAIVLYNHANDEAESFKILHVEFQKNAANFIDFNAINIYYTLYLKNLESGKITASEKDFMEMYNTLTGQITVLKNKMDQENQALKTKQQTQILDSDEKRSLSENEQSLKSLDLLIRNINNQSSKYIKCSTLTDFYQKDFDLKKEDPIWLETAVNALYKNKCFTDPVLEKTALALHKIKPTANSAFHLGSIFERKNNMAEAIRYYNEAATLEKNQTKKYDLYYKTASISLNINKREAKDYILKAAKANPTSGRPYLFLANLYSSAGSDCVKTDFEKKALNWLSIETVKKAAAIEPQLQPAVNDIVKAYSKNLPTKKDISDAGLKKNKKLTFGCWINETITIP